MARRYWTCRKCSHRNERTASRKCFACKEETKPKKRVPKHAEVLRDTSYETWAALSVEIHGGELHNCAVCGRSPVKVRRHDRDHDHRSGLARGICCAFCNRERLRGIANAEEARMVLEYFLRVEKFYAHQTEGEANG